MGGALVGLGGVSYFFYQKLEEQVETEIQSVLSKQVIGLQGQLTEIERSTNDLARAAKVMQQAGTTNPQSYRKMVFEDYFQTRVPLVMGLGFGQAAQALVPDRQWFWPYFSVDQGSPDGVGQPLPAPDRGIRYADLFVQDNYPQQDYYTVPVDAEKPVWTRPYDWYGNSVTSYLVPFRNSQGKLLGVAGQTVNLKVFGEQIDGPVLRSEGYFMIFNGEGNLLAYPREAQLAQDQVSYETFPELVPIWDQLQQDAPGLVQAGGLSWAHQRIPSTNWLMLAAVPNSVVYGPVLAITVTGALGAGVLLALVVALFVQQLNRRLQPILRDCNRLAQADAQTLAKLEKQDEIGQLSISFYNLLAQVAANEERIREEVARSVQAREQLKQAASSQAESELLQEEVGQILEVVSAVEGGDLTLQAEVSERVTGLVADTLNRLIEQLAHVLAQVLNTAQQVSQGSTALEDLAKTVALNADQQAQSVVQVLGLSERVEQAAQESAQQVSLANDALLSVRSTVQQGHLAIEQLAEGIEVLQQGTARMVQRMKTLGEFVGLADQFVQEQGQIASLTQVLAINASLVAARASEQRDPRQFQVVARDFEAIANQVSSLAQQTNEGLGSLQQRTHQIHTVVSAIDGDVQSLSGLVANFNAAVEQSTQVFANVQTVSEQVVTTGESVGQSSHEIVQSAQTTAEAMRGIATLAERTAELTRQARLQSEQMDHLSVDLLNTIHFFRLPDALRTQEQPESVLLPLASPPDADLPEADL
jgi:twitching motility protein PilJ